MEPLQSYERLVTIRDNRAAIGDEKLTRQTRHDRRMTAAGRCPNCGKKNRSRHYRCSKCRARRRAATLARKGLPHGEPAETGN
jgi:hypothetical protein